MSGDPAVSSEGVVRGKIFLDKKPVDCLGESVTVNPFRATKLASDSLPILFVSVNPSGDVFRVLWVIGGRMFARGFAVTELVLLAGVKLGSSEYILAPHQH